MSTAGARKRAHRLQARICGTSYHLEPTAERVYEQIKRALQSGYHQEHLRTPPHRFGQLLKLDRAPKDHTPQATHMIVGGPRGKDFNRRLSADTLFERHDGALFNFAVILGQGQQAPELLAYDFELRFPDPVITEHALPRFVRFDLNLPGHGNADAGLRCHLHPGHDDLQAPSALMTPVEVLELFLYGLALPDKPRAK